MLCETEPTVDVDDIIPFTSMIQAMAAQPHRELP